MKNQILNIKMTNKNVNRKRMLFVSGIWGEAFLILICIFAF